MLPQKQATWMMYRHTLQKIPNKLTLKTITETHLYIMQPFVVIMIFLLRKGSRDDQHRRAYYNALTREIRQILRDYQVMQSFIENSNSNSRNQDGAGLKKAMRSIFQNHVKRVKVKLSEDPEEEEQEISSLHFTDFRIIVTNEEKTEQEVFYCHLFVLIARWPYFRNHILYQFDPTTWNEKCSDVKELEQFFQNQIQLIQGKLS